VKEVDEVRDGDKVKDGDTVALGPAVSCPYMDFDFLAREVMGDMSNTPPRPDRPPLDVGRGEQNIPPQLLGRALQCGEVRCKDKKCGHIAMNRALLELHVCDRKKDPIAIRGDEERAARQGTKGSETSGSGETSPEGEVSGNCPNKT
jgi:hypothetical protein